MRVSWPSSAADWEQTGAQFEQELQLAMQFQSPDVWIAQFKSLNDMADSMNEMIQSVGEIVFGAHEATWVPRSWTHDESLPDINARWCSLPLEVTPERPTLDQDVTDNDAAREAQPPMTPERPTPGRDDTDNGATGEAQPRSTVKRRRLAPQHQQRAPVAQQLHPVTVAGPRAVRFGVGRPEVQIVMTDLSLATRRCDLAARRDSRRRRLRARWQAEGGAMDADWEELERRSKQRAEKRAAQAARGVRGLEQLRAAMTSRDASADAAPVGAAAAAAGVAVAAAAAAPSGGSERKRQRV